MVDYKDVLLTLVPVAPRTQHLCSFLCELSLLHTSLAVYAPARLAAAALLLARLTHGQSKEPALPPASPQGLSQGLGIPEVRRWEVILTCKAGRERSMPSSWMRRNQNELKALL